MPPMLYVVIFLAAFFAVEGLSMLAAERLSGSRAMARRRLRRIALGIQSPEVQGEESILRSRLEAGRARIDLSHLVPGGMQLERRLYQAGISTPPGQFVLLCLGLGLVAWLAFALLLGSRAQALPFLAVGLLPLWNVARRRARRMTLFEQQFPQALDLMTRALRAGHSLAFGFRMVGDELPDPVGAEFAQVAEEIKLGQELRVALANLIYRVEAGDLPFFVTAITIQRETGGNLAEVLGKLSGLIRERFALYGKVRALTAVGRASANLLVATPFLLVLLLYTAGGQSGRSYLQPLLETPPGHTILLVAGLLVATGYLVCRRMARIEV